MTELNYYIMIDERGNEFIVESLSIPAWKKRECQVVRYLFTVYEDTPHSITRFDNEPGGVTR